MLDMTHLRKELNSILTSFDKTLLPHKEADAFVVWFVKARFNLEYQEAVNLLTDYRADKVIDAIYIDEREHQKIVYVIQSKFRLRIEGSEASGTLKEFATVWNYFSGGDVNNAVYRTAGPRTKEALDAARKKLKEGYELKLIFVSTKNIIQSHLEEVRSLEGIPEENFDAYDNIRLSRLFQDFLEDKIPEISFELKLENADTSKQLLFNGVEALLGTVKADTIYNLIKDWKDDLFNSNVRSAVPRSTSVNEGIAETLRNHPETFWLLNNGIIFLCKKLKPLKTKSLWLESANIINGQQTARTIFRVISEGKEEARNALITVKIIQIPPEISETYQNLSISIITASNRQTQINERDLRSIDPRQVALQREFEKRLLFPARDKRYFYERKRYGWDTKIKATGQSRRWEYINNVDMAKARIALLQRPSLYQKGENSLFSEYYDDIFGHVEKLDAKKLASNYLFPWWCWKNIRNSYYSKDKIHEFTSLQFKGASTYHILAYICYRVPNLHDRIRIVNLWEANSEEIMQLIYEISDALFEGAYRFFKKLQSVDEGLAPTKLFKSESYTMIKGGKGFKRNVYQDLKDFLDKTEKVKISRTRTVDINDLFKRLIKTAENEYIKLQEEYA